MSWTPSKNSAVSFVLGKAASALEEIRKQEINGTGPNESVARIICDAVDLCRERVSGFSDVDVKDRIMIAVANLLEMIVVLMRLVRQLGEKGLTTETRGLLEKSGLMNNLSVV